MNIFNYCKLYVDDQNDSLISSFFLIQFSIDAAHTEGPYNVVEKLPSTRLVSSTINTPVSVLDTTLTSMVMTYSQIIFHGLGDTVRSTLPNKSN